MLRFLASIRGLLRSPPDLLQRVTDNVTDKFASLFVFIVNVTLLRSFHPVRACVRQSYPCRSVSAGRASAQWLRISCPSSASCPSPFESIRAIRVSVLNFQSESNLI